LLRDLNADVAAELDGTQYSLRVGSDTLVAYRDSAVMG